MLSVDYVSVLMYQTILVFVLEVIVIIWSVVHVGGHPKNIRDFYFDNTKHDIVISETKCRMCIFHNRNCRVENGNICPFNIPEYTKDFANKIDHLKKE